MTITSNLSSRISGYGFIVYGDQRNGSMNITLNGVKKEVPDNLTVIGLLESLNIQHPRVAVELNMEIVKKDRYAVTMIKEGDSLEVVSFMAGGGNPN